MPIKAAPRLVGIVGYMGAGKDTVARHIAARYGHQIMAFADPLRAALCAMFGWPVSRFEDRVWRATPVPGFNVSPRSLLQTLGTEWGRRTVDPDFWVKLANHRVNVAMGEYLNMAPLRFVFSDVRFPNEAGWIRMNGGTLIGIRREAAEPTGPVHESERHIPDLLDLCDRTSGCCAIRNDSTVEDLLCAVDMLAPFWDPR